MKYFVTGGAGFIGANFILQRFQNGTEPIDALVNLDALTYAGNPDNLIAVRNNPRYSFVKGDIGNAPLVQELLAAHTPDCIVNFAAESHVDRSIHSPLSFLDTNVMGTGVLLTETLAYWEKLPADKKEKFRFLHVSTDEVFGDLSQDDPAFTEETPYNPSSPYSASKAASDHLVRAYHHTYGLPILITNCSNNYGAYQFPEKLIPLALHKALQEQPIPLYGDGTNVRDWLYVTDHCRGIQLVLDKGRVGETYLLGGQCEVMNKDLLAGLCSVLDRKRPRKQGRYADLIHTVTDRKGHDRRYAVNIEKIQSELGWRPSVNLTEGLERTITWYLDNQKWTGRITTGAYQDWLKKNYAP